ncbi:hypothetical protein HL667_06335 [Bradyrhizobium sp. 83012]|uniref:5'-3' exonuclease domain-containing protein n=1 Tax=Bradyrhizobium aeschynomenes TaxID=2734909 RepID=A0ABX2CAV6_9BRAD|nr:hypothetical protein [Bradyrhizobium aeschynomenes]
MGREHALHQVQGRSGGLLLPVSEKLTVLIDGDIIAYKAASVHQKTFDFGDGPVYETDLEGAIGLAENLIYTAAEKLKASSIVACLTGPLMEISARNFRKELLPTYKGNRKGPKPVLLPSVKEYIRSTFDTKIKDGIEADDVMGIMCTHPSLIPGKKVIVSIDKDLLQVPGRHYNPDTDTKRMVSEQAGDRLFMMQTLTGDITDNYPGLPRVGPVKAAAILDEEPDGPIDPEITQLQWHWSRVVKAFEKKGLTEDDALVQARCARILRHTDYDFKRNEPILWSPR